MFVDSVSVCKRYILFCVLSHQYINTTGSYYSVHCNLTTNGCHALGPVPFLLPKQSQTLRFDRDVMAHGEAEKRGILHMII